jgi:Transcription factor WhiB
MSANPEVTRRRTDRSQVALLAAVGHDLRDQAPSALLADRALQAEVTGEARCSDGTLDPDEWFPVSTDPEAARREAAGAIAVCGACPVRDACLELSMRHWKIGQHGIWGGLVPAERAAVRRQVLESARRTGYALSVADRTADGTAAPVALQARISPG